MGGAAIARRATTRGSAKPIAISDSANFYCSCERIFDPKLRGVPMIVLSNNDGCAIARSEEAKALGIKMGDPYHLIRDKIEEHGIRVFSSNYTLYHSVSVQIANIYAMFSPNVEVYSIDESFLDLSGFGHTGRDREHYARSMRRQVMDWVGVPVRVGIAPTKTLAKCANELAKKNPIFDGVCDAMDDRLMDWLLDRVPIGDLWGVGSRTEAKLHALGIGTAAELRDMPLRQARAVGTVVLERLVLELQGEPCLDLELVAPQRKGMAVTRSAGTPMTDRHTLLEAMTAHATRAAEKLRSHGLVAGTLTAFFHTNRHKPDRPQHGASRTTKLFGMSNDTLDLVKAARRCVEAAWKGDPEQSRYAYTKVGIMLDDLVLEIDRPRMLFDEERTTPERVSRVLDDVNGRWGKKTLVLGSEGFTRSWKLRADHHSPRYTTRLSDVPVVH